MSRYVEVCWCGHDKATHFEQRHTCLGMHCDDCRMYIHRDDPDRPERTKKPEPRYAIWEDDVDVPPTPIPTPPAPGYGPAPFGPAPFKTPVVPHPFWCLCPQCYPGTP